MNTIWLISLFALWGVVILNILLTLRIVRWLHTAEGLQDRLKEREQLPELTIGTPAPDFQAKTFLENKSVRLQTYAGQKVAFLFVSPHCGSCRKKLPELVKLGKQAQEKAQVAFVVVSDSNAAETFAWITAIQEESGMEISLPLLLAPFSQSEFVRIYDPRGMTPYYCLIDEQGIVQSRGPIGMPDWMKLQREWEGITTMSSSRRPPSHLYT